MSYVLTFTDLLSHAGLVLSDVRLLRHQAMGLHGETPYSLWVKQPEEFIRYQSLQREHRRSYFSAPYWASFVVSPGGGTIFVGLFDILLLGSPSEADAAAYNQIPIDGGAVEGVDDLYRATPSNHLASYVGRLYVDWGSGTRSWVQRADSRAGRAKRVVELTRRFREPVFPGFAKFVSSLSEIAKLPVSWQTALRSAGGIYLLTCPKTKEQYVGKASGHDGFLGRWFEYLQTGHGGNVALRSRDPSDYQVSILEFFGSSLEWDESEIARRETLWKRKLQSREMGLNRN